jgi:hypothetical protein
MPRLFLPLSKFLLSRNRDITEKVLILWKSLPVKPAVRVLKAKSRIWRHILGRSNKHQVSKVSLQRCPRPVPCLGLPKPSNSLATIFKLKHYKPFISRWRNGESIKPTFYYFILKIFRYTVYLRKRYRYFPHTPLPTHAQPNQYASSQWYMC